MRKFAFAILALAFAASTATAQIVTLNLDSSQAGQNVAPGAAIDWTITVEVSSGDNAGLALVSTDLMASNSNPDVVDIAPGNEGSIDGTMAQFSRPLGISNPAEGGATTGYIGVQRGVPGSLFLRQIGGGQNTFGVAGASVGQDANVQAGVGQSGPQTILSGTFNAPATTGTYTFQLENAIANVLVSAETAPALSPVVAATVDTASNGSFSFTVSTAQPLGDMNCDGSVNLADVPAMAEALVDPTGYAANYPGCDPLNGDFADDDLLNGADIAGFVAALLAP